MIKLSCPAKLNLDLRVCSQRPDAYHELDSIFALLSWPRDELVIEGESDRLVINCEIPGLTGPDNILHKCEAIFRNATGFKGSYRLNLIKRIPMGAGLGGGSSNAAQYLRFLNARLPKPLSLEELIPIASRIGADVPFFLYGRFCHASGIGDVLTPIKGPENKIWAVLLWPEIAISSREAFKLFDEKHGSEASQNALTKATVKDKEISLQRRCWEQMANDLENVVFAAWPQLATLKRKMTALGARYAAMSGSGSTIFGLFDDLASARQATRSLAGHYRFTYLSALS